MVIQYKHHGKIVSVQEDLKGKHRDYCLCYHCAWFQPQDDSLNCQVANVLFNLCQMYHIITPVWECERFNGKE
jgi:hypothetical protein